MIALLTVLSYLFAFALGGATACAVIGLIMVHDYRRWQRARRVRGDGEDLDVDGVMESVSER